MSDFLASIYYDRWILHALVLLPLAGRGTGAPG